MSKTILLVEDNPSDQKLTLRGFARSGVANEVALVSDGVEALDYLFGTGPHAAAPPPLPTLVLLDLQLPRLDGAEVLRRLRAEPRTALLPVVVLTASREEEDIARSYLLGANGYVRKPVEFTEFAEAARAVGLFWLLVNQPPPPSPAAPREASEKR